MPSVKLDLGAYVVVRPPLSQPPRKDGTRRVLFEVPARLRPSGWPSTRPLPTEGRRGDLSDPAEVARIKADAERFYAELIAAQGQQPEQPKTRTFDTLIRTWRNTQRYKGLKPRTQRGYDFTVGYIEDWSEASAHPDPTNLTKPEVESFLGSFDDRPTTRRMVKIVLKMVMDQAIDLGWRLDNPVARIKMSVPKTRVAIWEAADVETYAWTALSIGEPGMAALILMQWEIGQRLTDAYLFRRGEHYNAAAGLFEFEQDKTAEKVAIPVSDRLRAILGHLLADGRLYLFHRGGTGRPFGRLVGNRLEADDTGGAHVFARARALAVAAGSRPLKLKWLRHSCVVQLARCGCTVPEIASITGHTIASVETILERYLPRDSTVARNAQVKRGLVERAS